MASDFPHSRRASAAAASIPPAPPLPPPKFAARNVFTRFVTQSFNTYGSRPPSVQANRGDGPRSNALATRAPGASSISSQDASHKTGLEISAVDINHDKTHAVLAGHEILKTISIAGNRCAEEDNLRSAIINYNAAGTGPGQGGAASRHRETFEIHDVKWSHGQFDSYIATAATSGKVILYDLNRTGKEVARLHEHHRQVHKLAFNPHQGYLLLSGSQDATVRMWDLRDMRRDVFSCASRDKFSGLSEGIRDLKWSPTDGVEFAFGTDNGVIQRWDYRQNRGPKLKINAHDKTVNSIDWHPDGKHLLSASSDRTVRVWDFSSEVRRQKPAFMLRAPFPVYNARWRPPCWNAESRDQGSFQCTQLATSYDRDHAMVHLWDFRRPFLPFREIYRYNMAPTDMLWHSRDLLWTVGREGHFTQNDVHFVPKVIDRRNMQAFAVSPSGEIGAFSQTRSRVRNSDIGHLSGDAYLLESNRRSSPEKGSVVRNSADDSVDDSFLSSSYKRHHGRTASNRSAKSFGSTPPSSEAALKVTLLNDSLASRTDTFKPNQAAIRGSVPGFMNLSIFTYLAQKYKAIALSDPPSVDSYFNLPRLFRHNAEYAERAALFRLAETWRIVGHSIFTVVSARAEEHRKIRIRSASQLPSSREGTAKELAPSTKTPGKSTSLAVRAIYGPSHPTTIQSPSNHQESTSNLPTPLAKPVTYANSHLSRTHPKLPDLDQEEDLNLPPAIAGPHSNGDNFQPQTERRNSVTLRPQFTSPQWYNTSNDLNDRRAMVGSYRAQPRTPLSFDPASSHGIDIRVPPKFDRHNSDESFAMFSASSESQRETSIAGSFASMNSQSGAMDSIPEDSNHCHARSPAFLRSPSSPLARSARQDRSFNNGPPSSHPQFTNRNPLFGESATSPKSTHQHGSLNAQMPRILSPTDFSAEKRKAVEDIDVLRRNNYLMRHDSSESEANPSFKNRPLYAGSLLQENMEASGTIVPDEFRRDVKSPDSTQHVTHLSAKLHGDSASVSPATKPNPIEESTQLVDYQARNLDLDTEAGAPFAVVDMIRSVLNFHTGVMADAQASSLILLLVAPLLPTTHPLNSGDTELITSTYTDVLTSLGMPPSQVHTIIHDHVASLLQTGINPFEAEATISTYHTQLNTLGLFNAAASLRRLAYPVYPGVYDSALKDTQLNLLCTKCKSPINNPRDKTRCETCTSRTAPCPICGCKTPTHEPAPHRKSKSRRPASKGVQFDTTTPLSRPPIPPPPLASPDDPQEQHLATSSSPIHPTALAPPPTLWTACPTCGHGGHSACITAWFADPAFSEGACPTQGCVCDCVAGPRRARRLRGLEAEKAEREKGRVVRGDEWRVQESRAVVGVRGNLSGAGGGASGNLVVGGGEQSPGGRKEEGRRVRLVEPGGSGGGKKG